MFQSVDQWFNRLDRYILGKARASLELEHGKVSRALHLLKQALQVCMHADTTVVFVHYFQYQL